MLLREKYLKILSEMLPAGAVGVSLMLGGVAPAAADQDRAQQRGPVADPGRVSERLAAIRDAVSEIDRPQTSTRRDKVAWWAWRNGGGGWRNGGGAWRNGGAAWGNGGWHNGGWHNGGWRNGPWNNFWRNF